MKDAELRPCVGGLAGSGRVPIGSSLEASLAYGCVFIDLVIRQRRKGYRPPCSVDLLILQRCRLIWWLECRPNRGASTLCRRTIIASVGYVAIPWLTSPGTVQSFWKNYHLLTRCQSNNCEKNQDFRWLVSEIINVKVEGIDVDWSQTAYFTPLLQSQ